MEIYPPTQTSLSLSLWRMDVGSFLSSPTSSYDSAVEDVLSEILDVAAIEQIQSLPSPYCSTSSVLPSQLETRFHRLKSFTPTKANQTPHKEEEQQVVEQPCPSSPPPSSPLQPHSPHKLKSVKPFPPLDSPKKTLKSSSGKEFDDFLDSSSSIGSSSAPHKQGCCFWVSPKKIGRKTHRSESYEDGGWRTDNEMLSDLGTFSVRSQRERMKAVLKEQEKISKEAEKVIKWVKQASARMSADDFGDELYRDKAPSR